MRPLILTGAFWALATGCAHTELTADEHRLEAQHEEAQAAQDAARYDPSATVTRTSRPSVDGLDEGLRSYNPTAEFLGASEAHLRQAHAHYEAAKSLEKFEDAACTGLTPAERGACPLFTAWVAQVEETSKGVGLHLKAEAPTPQLFAQMQCHLAYAKARGYERQSCPLYIKGVTLDLKGSVIWVTGDSGAVASEVRSEARVLFGNKVATSTR